MDIVVSDTNIFIDLYTIGLLDDFFALPLTIHTVDFVINEITESTQINAISKFISRNKLYVKKLSSSELQDIYKLKDDCGGNVSFTDCAVWKYAQVNRYKLLTGDRQLRNKASAAGVNVAGILFIFDHLIESSIISPNVAIDKLKALQSHNSRLPKQEVDHRIQQWGNRLTQINNKKDCSTNR